MATFDVLFKAWSSQMTDHIKEIRDDLQEAEKTILLKSLSCQEKVEELDLRVQALREEFIVHKTKVNTRIALISGAITIFVFLSTLILNIDKIRDILNRDKIEIVNTVK